MANETLDTLVKHPDTALGILASGKNPDGTDFTLATSGGGGGGAATIADGDDVATGATTDASTANTVIGRLKKLLSVLPAALGQTTMSASLPVAIASNQTAVPITLDAAALAALESIDLNAASLAALENIGLNAGETHIGEVGGNLITVEVEFTRPSDTTAYTAGDVVGDSTSALTMQAVANAARVSGGSGYIVGIKIATDKKSITPRLRVHTFNTNGATLANDNAAWKELYADGSKRVAPYDMPSMVTGADTTNSDMSRAVDMSMRIPYVCAVTSLYFVLEALDAFTPASGEKFKVTLTMDRN